MVTAPHDDTFNDQVVQKAPGGNQGPSLTQPAHTKDGCKREVVYPTD